LSADILIRQAAALAIIEALMKQSDRIAATIDDYIAGHPPTIRARLSAMRATIRQHAPEAEERISYRIPTFYWGGNLVHFAAFDRHVGFYPGASGIAAFQDALARYTCGKGSVQFPHDEPLPLELVADMVRFRVAEQSSKGAARGRRRPRPTSSRQPRRPMPASPEQPVKKHKIFTTSFASVYPYLVRKAERKGRTREEVDQVIRWLTGYSPEALAAQIEQQKDFETFFGEAPAMHPNVARITGVVCGVRIEEIEDPLMRNIRYLDKLVDELAKGRPMEKILRT
jgi:uncharacterized protein YdhG (YjbR/CyaY superfamily)